MKTIEFFFDIGSPYSYLASERIEAVAAAAGAHIWWRPFLLGGVFKAVGNQPPAMLAPRARYLIRDLGRWAAHYGVPFNMPPRFPLNTLQVQRVLAAEPRETRPALTHQLFRAYWVDGEDVSERDVLEGLVGAERLARAHHAATKDRLRETTSEAVARGAFGAPSFFVDGELFFGNDRLHFVERAAREA